MTLSGYKKQRQMKQELKVLIPILMDDPLGAVRPGPGYND